MISKVFRFRHLKFHLVVLNFKPLHTSFGIEMPYSLVQTDTGPSRWNSDELVGVSRRQTSVWLKESKCHIASRCFCGIYDNFGDRDNCRRVDAGLRWFLCFWYFLFRCLQPEVCVDMLAAFPLSYDNTIPRTRQSISIPVKKWRKCGNYFCTTQIGLWKWLNFWKAETRCNQNVNRKTEENSRPTWISNH